MALTQLDYPVTGTLGNYMNVFPSQRKLNINFNRKDVTIDSIASGTDGVVEITVDDPLDANIVVGDYVVWVTDSYKLRSSRIINILSTTVFEVDAVFTSTDATNGWVNYRKNWFLEARFVAETVPTDQQGEVDTVIDDFARVPSGLDGNLSLDLSIVKDVLSPSFSLATENATSLSQVFKVQFRESYETNRDGSWVSPDDDIPIMLVLAAKDVPFNNFINADVAQLFYYDQRPFFITYVYSDVNDNGNSVLTFNLKQYTLAKVLISETDIASFSDESGVFNILVIPDDIAFNTVFVGIDVVSVSSQGQYDPSQYDPSQYA